MDLFYIILVSLWTIGLANKELPPVIKEHPKPMVAKRNYPVTLKCGTEGDTQIRWFKDGQPLRMHEEQHTRKTLLNNGDLFFLRVISNKKESDAGLYWCEAINQYGSVTSNKVMLTVALLGDLFVENPLPFIKARQNEPLTLHCRPPKGTPPPSVSWKHNGHKLSNSTRRYSTLEGDLVFENVVYSDEGKYACIAENEAGKKESQSAEVLVMSKPWFDTEPQNVSTIAGKNVEFSCKARGTPRPNITWRKLNDDLPRDRTTFIEGKPIQLNSVVLSDSGIYVCEAQNEAGYIKREVHLMVVAAPTFKEKPNNQFILKNEDMKLKCRVVGDPAPLIFWKLPFGNSLFMQNQNIGNVSVSEDGHNLRVKNLQIRDSGEYFCWGINAGGAITTSAEVVVLDTYPPPIIGLFPKDVETVPGSSVTFPCEVTSETHQPTITWWFKKEVHLHAQEVTSTETNNLLATGTLAIKSVDNRNSGIYTCKVQSEFGSVEAEAILKVSDHAKMNLIRTRPVPAPPSKPRISFVNKTSIHLSWLPNSGGSGGNTESYTIEYWRTPWQEWRVAKTDMKDPSSIITDLRPHTAYAFLVKAINRNGESFPSPWSDFVYTNNSMTSNLSYEAQQKIKRKLSKPVITLNSALSHKSDQVKLSWEKLSASDIELDGVIVYTVGEEKIESETVLGTFSSSHIIENLKPNSIYTFFVVPFWRTFEGVPSNARKVSTPDKAPSIPPTGVRIKSYGAGTTVIQWDPIMKNGKKDKSVTYKVSLNVNNSTTYKETRNTWFKVEGLEKERFYMFKVAAVTKGGTGPWSVPALLDVEEESIVQDNQQDNSSVPVLYDPPHPVWILYVLCLLLVFIIVGVLAYFYVRRFKNKSTSSTLESSTGPAYYATTGICEQGCRNVNMYSEQKLWRPNDSDQDSSLSSGKLLHPEHLVNEYAEPRIHHIGDSTEPYMTTALLTPSSPLLYNKHWRAGPNAGYHPTSCPNGEIQINWSKAIPPPPTCPPPTSFPPNTGEMDSSSNNTSDYSGDRRHYNTGSSSQYENAGESEQYDRPCVNGTAFDAGSDHTYAVYSSVCRDHNPPDTFKTFSTLQANPIKNIRQDLNPVRVEPPKSNTH